MQLKTILNKVTDYKSFVFKKLLMNWFKSKGMSSGAVEGFNNKVKLTMRKGYGFRTFRTLEIVLYHALGKLPEPDCTHKFW